MLASPAIAMEPRFLTVTLGGGKLRRREETMKEWPGQWKTNLIERDNLHRNDLYHSLPGVRPIDPL
jgi:hypothetical protein